MTDPTPKKSSFLSFYLPPPSPLLTHCELLPESQHRDFEEFPTRNSIYTPLIQILDLDLLSLIHTSATSSKEEIKVEKTRLDNLEQEIHYDILVQESFDDIREEIVHPFDETIEVESVYPLLPFTTDDTNCLLAVVEDVEINNVILGEGRIPGVMSTDLGDFTTTAMDISDYMFVFQEGNEYYYRDIGACLKLKKAINPVKRNLTND